LLTFFANQRTMNGNIQVQQIVRDEVGQVTIFGVVPDMFDRVEFRGVGRKPFEVEPSRMNVGDLTSGAAMRIRGPQRKVADAAGREKSSGH
jgi:hypothetical protein